MTRPISQSNSPRLLPKILVPNKLVAIDASGNVVLVDPGTVGGTSVNWGNVAGTLTDQTDLVSYIAAAIASLVASAPSALDTLNELATALGNDANFASTMTAALAAKASLTGAETLTNKRITPRVSSNTSSSTPTPNADTDDIYLLTALAAGATFSAPSGTPTAGQGLIIRIKDNGTARSLAFNAIYRAIGVTLPTTTVVGKTLYLAMLYNSVDAKWDVVAKVQET